MCLAGEDELYGELLVVDDAGETVEVSEEEVGALISGEAASEADDERVGVYFFKNLDYCGGIALVCKPFCLEIALYEVDEFVFHRAAHIPDFLVFNLEDAFPGLGVALVVEYLLAEFLGVE